MYACMYVCMSVWYVCVYDPSLPPYHLLNIVDVTYICTYKLSHSSYRMCVVREEILLKKPAWLLLTVREPSLHAQRYNAMGV